LKDVVAVITVKRPSHVKLTWSACVGGLRLVCVGDTAACWQTVGEKLVRIQTSSFCRQQFANMLLCRSRAPIWVCRHWLANNSLTCEGRLKWFGVILVNTAKLCINYRSTKEVKALLICHNITFVSNCVINFSCTNIVHLRKSNSRSLKLRNWEK